jgi:hypothetical protein
MADWLMFLLAVRRDELEWAEVQAAFWEAYGMPDNSRGVQFREEIYKAMHLGSVRLWYLKSHNLDNVDRAGYELGQIAQLLPSLAI